MNMFDLKYLKNVSTLKLDQQKCTGCRMCTIVCPHAVFIIENKKAKIGDLDMCMECGACAMNCKDEAITVNKGVGCATAVINSYVKKTEPTCGCNTCCN